VPFSEPGDPVGDGVVAGLHFVPSVHVEASVREENEVAVRDEKRHPAGICSAGATAFQEYAQEPF